VKVQLHAAGIRKAKMKIGLFCDITTCISVV